MTGRTIAPNATWRFLNEVLGRKDLSVHGFRTAFRRGPSRTAGPKRCETALDHVTGSKVERLYSRDADLLEQRRLLMQAWDNYCGRTEPHPAHVIPIRKAKAGR